MPGKVGGKRPGAGRPKGAKQLVTEEAIKRAGDGETPLEYMLRVMRDEKGEVERRDRMAVGAAPYMHAKLANIEHSGKIDISIYDRIMRARDRA